MSSTSEATLPPPDSLLRLLVDQITDYAIFLLSPEGEVATWNPGAERFKGYKPGEIIGKHFRIFYPAEDQRAGKPEHELEVAAASGRIENEGWRVRKDGSRFWANVVVTAIRNAQGQVVGFGKVTRDLTERKRAEEQLRNLSKRLLNIQDEERKRIGRELHDGIGQYLIAVKMTLDVLALRGHFDDLTAHKDIQECTRNMEHAIQEVRTLSYLLYPPMLEETGLAMAIRWHLEGFSRRSGIQATSEIPDNFGRLSRDVELALFRVFQESLTNVHRHSGSKTVRIRLAIDGGNAVLEIRDQGKGMLATSPEPEAESLGTLGVGIRGMSERLRQFGGNLEITSTTEGTTVKASVPLNQSQQEPA